MKSVLPFVKLTGLLALLSCSAWANDNIKLHFSEPDWQFAIANKPASQTSAQLKPEESNFARTIAPLLEKQNYKGVIEAFASRELANDSAALQLLRGQILLSLKQLDKASIALNAALKTMPDLALAHRSLSMVYMLQKNYDGARTHLVRSIELGVADAQLYGQLAYINLKSGQPFSAVAGYQQALYLAPDEQQWQTGLLYALMQSQSWEQAAGLLSQQLASQPDNAELWLMKGQIAMQQQRYTAALADLEAAIRLGENDTANLLTAARLHLREGSVSRAVDLLSDSIKKLDKSEINQVVDALNQTLPWLLAQDKTSDAKRLLKVADNSGLGKKQQASLSVYRGQLALAEKHYKSARKHLQKAVELNPANGQAVLALANVYRQLQQPQQAELYLVRAASLSDTKVPALLAHAQLKIEQKDYQAALTLLRNVLRVEPARSDIQQNIRQLEQLVNQSQYTS